MLDGNATFTIAGETTDAPAGTLVFVRDPDGGEGCCRGRGRRDDPEHRREARRGVSRPALGGELGGLPAPRSRRVRGGEAAPGGGRARVSGRGRAPLQPRVRRGAARRERCRARPSPARGGARGPVRRVRAGRRGSRDASRRPSLSALRPRRKLDGIRFRRAHLPRRDRCVRRPVRRGPAARVRRRGLRDRAHGVPLGDRGARHRALRRPLAPARGGARPLRRRLARRT